MLRGMAEASVPTQEFRPERSPVEGLDAAAQGFFEIEQRRRAAAAGEAPPAEQEAEPQPAEADAAEAATEPVEAEAQEPEEGAEAVAEEPAEAEAAAESEDMVDLGNGEQVPLSELLKGYSRQSDYTRKTQELAEQRKAFEAERAGIDQERQQALAGLQQLSAQLQAELARTQPSPQDLEQLRLRDPAEWSARMYEQQQRQQLVQFAQAQQAQVEAQERAQRVPQEIAALQAKLPEFADNFESHYRKTGEWAMSPEGGGLSPEEWDATFDHRHVIVLEKARRYDEATRQTPRVTKKLAEKKPRVIRPGTQSPPGQSETEAYSASLAQVKDGGTDALADAFLKREQLNRARRQAG